MAHTKEEQIQIQRILAGDARAYEEHFKIPCRALGRVSLFHRIIRMSGIQN
jgi:hypothetical protein